MTRGRVHNVNEVGMTQRQRRRHDSTSEGVMWRAERSVVIVNDVTWRDVDSVISLEEDRDQTLHDQPS